MISGAYNANNLVARIQVGEDDKQDSEAIRLFTDPVAARVVSRYDSSGKMRWHALVLL